MLANQIDKDIQRIDVADIVGPVRDLDMGEISVKSGTPGFVTFVDVVNVSISNFYNFFFIIFRLQL